MLLSLSSLDLKIAVVEKIKRTNREHQALTIDQLHYPEAVRTCLKQWVYGKKLKASTPINKIHVSEKGQFGFSHICSKDNK